MRYNRNPASQRAAVDCLQALAYCDDLRDKMLDDMDIVFIQELLDSPDFGRSLLYFLIALASSPETAVKLLQLGVLEAAVPLLRSVDTIMTIEVASLCSSIVVHDEVAELITDESFIDDVWRLWDAGLADHLKQRILAAMQNISTPMKFVKGVLECGIMLEATRILTTESVDVAFALCGVFGNLTRDDKAQQAITSLNLIPLLVPLMDQTEESDDPTTSRISVFCTLRNMAVEPAVARYFAQADVLDRILHHLKDTVDDPSRDHNFLRFILSFAYNLSTDDGAVEPLRKRHTADIISPLLQHPDGFIRIATLLTLINVTANEPNQQKQLRLDAKFVETLTTILDHSLRGQMYAELIWLLFAPLQALANLSLNADNRPMLLASPELPGLVARFFSQPRDDRSTLHAVALVARLTEVTDFTKNHAAIDAAMERLAVPVFTRVQTPTSEFAQVARENTARHRGLPPPKRERMLVISSAQSSSGRRPGEGRRLPVWQRAVAFVVQQLWGSDHRYDF